MLSFIHNARKQRTLGNKGAHITKICKEQECKPNGDEEAQYKHAGSDLFNVASFSTSASPASAYPYRDQKIAVKYGQEYGTFPVNEEVQFMTRTYREKNWIQIYLQ